MSDKFLRNSEASHTDKAPRRRYRGFATIHRAPHQVPFRGKGRLSSSEARWHRRVPLIKKLCYQETDHGRRCRVARCSHADSAIESRSLSFKSAESEGTLKNETGFDSLKSCHKFPELHLSYNLIQFEKQFTPELMLNSMLDELAFVQDFEGENEACATPYL